MSIIANKTLSVFTVENMGWGKPTKNLNLSCCVLTSVCESQISADKDPESGLLSQNTGII